MKKSVLLLLAASVAMAGSAVANDAGVKFSHQSQKVSANALDGMKRVETPVRSASVAVSFGKAGVKGKSVLKTAPTEVGTVSASYLNPTYFYIGESENGYIAVTDDMQPASRYAMPAYADLTWENASTGATSYSWEYISPNWMDATDESQLFLTTTATDLTTSYEWSQGSALNSPTLTATGGSDVAVFADETGVVFGGQEVDSEGGVFGTAMFDAADGVSWTDCSFAALGVSSDINESLFASLADECVILGFGNLYPAPAAPYAISKVWAPVMGTWSAGAELKCTVYSIKNGTINEELAYGTYTTTSASDASSIQKYDQIPTVNFDLLHYDGIWESEGYFTVSDSIYVEISSEDPKVKYLAPVGNIPNIGSDKWIERVLDDEGYLVVPEYQERMLNAYVRFSYSISMLGMEGEDILLWPSFYTFGGELANAGVWHPMGFMLYTDAAFGWLVDPVSESNVFSIPTTGGDSEVCYLFTYPDFNESIIVENDIEEDGIIDDAEWLEYVIELPYVEESAEGTSFYYGGIIFSADALPAGVEGRSATVEITATGAAPMYITVNQGTTGITAVTTSAAKVSVEGGNFVVTAPEAINAATVYNVAGQAVAASEIAGTTTIDGSSLAKGVYIVRFNDGSSVKVVK